MKSLKPPSLQHMVRLWRDTPEKVEKQLLKMYRDTPQFSYNPLYNLAVDMLRFGQSEDQVLECIRRRERRPKIQKILLDIVPLLSEYATQIRADYVVPITPRAYSLGRGLQIPFAPPLLYGIGGQAYIPWFVFWKNNPLKDKSLSLFVSLVKAIIEQDPDLENAKFQIVDFSAPSSIGSRILRVIDENDFEKLPQSEIDKMLDIFVAGYVMAEGTVSNQLIKDNAKEVDKYDQIFDPNQLSMFWD